MHKLLTETLRQLRKSQKFHKKFLAWADKAESAINRRSFDFCQVRFEVHYLSSDGGILPVKAAGRKISAALANAQKKFFRVNGDRHRPCEAYIFICIGKIRLAISPDDVLALLDKEQCQENYQLTDFAWHETDERRFPRVTWTTKRRGSNNFA